MTLHSYEGQDTLCSGLTSGHGMLNQSIDVVRNRSMPSKAAMSQTVYSLNNNRMQNGSASPASARQSQLWADKPARYSNVNFVRSEAKVILDETEYESETKGIKEFDAQNSIPCNN